MVRSLFWTLALHFVTAQHCQDDFLLIKGTSPLVYCLDLLHPHKQLLEIPLKLSGLIVKSCYLKCWCDGAFVSAVHLISTQPQGRPLIVLFRFRESIMTFIFTTFSFFSLFKNVWYELLVWNAQWNPKERQSSGLWPGELISKKKTSLWIFLHESHKDFHKVYVIVNNQEKNSHNHMLLTSLVLFWLKDVQ